MSELFTSNLHSSLIPTKVASEISGYNADYLARLCREKKIEGTQIGRSWLINRDSLESFVAAQEEKKRERSEELRTQREAEYRSAQVTAIPSPFVAVKEAKTMAAKGMRSRELMRGGSVIFPVRAEAPVRVASTSLKRAPREAAPSYHSRPLVAAAVALAVVAGSAYASTSPGFLTVATIIPTHAFELAAAIAPNLEHASSFRVTEADASADAARAPRLALPSASELSRTVAVAGSATTGSITAVHELTDTAREPFARTGTARIALDRIAFASDIAHDPLGSAINAYVMSGAYAYAAGASLGDTYLSTIVRAGTDALAAAGTTRDALAFVPRTSNTILDSYANGVYAWNDAAPKVAGSVVMALYDTGDATSNLAIRAPLAVRSANDRVAVSAYQAPREIAMAARTSTVYAAAVGLSGSVLAVPVKAEDTLLGMAGYAASMLDGTEAVSPRAGPDVHTAHADLAQARTSASLPAFAFATTSSSTLADLSASVVTAVPAHSWQQAFANFFSAGSDLVHVAFTSGLRSLASLLPGGTVTTPVLTIVNSAPVETLPLPTPADVTNSAGANSDGTASPASGASVTRTIVNNYYPKTIIGGVMDEAVLAIVRPFVRDSIDAAFKNVGSATIVTTSSGGTGNVNSDGATLTNVTISSGTANLSALTAGSTTLGATTVNGNLTVNGAASTTSLTTSNFGLGGNSFSSLLGYGLINNGGVLSVSTSTFGTASSSFSQGGNTFGAPAVLGTVDSNPLTFITNNAVAGTFLTNGNFGLGTSSPSERLTVNGNTLVSGSITAATLTSTGTTNVGSLTIGSLTGFLKATAGAVTTGLIDLSTDVTSTLPVSKGGTGSSTLTGILVGNGASPLASLLVSAPLSFSGTTLSIQQVSASTDGYLSSSDWNTFNTKFATSSTNFWLTTKTTSDLAEGSNLYFTQGRFDTAFAGKSTSDLAEGANKYFTDARARAALSIAGAGLSYDNSTGVLTVAGGYSIPRTASTTEWSSAYANRITTATAPLSITNNVISMTQSNASTNGYLSSTDWSNFNNKVSSTSLSGVYPVLYNSSTGAFSLAFSTTTNNTWGGTQTFTNTPVLGNLSGIIKATNGALSAAIVGTDYAPATSGSSILAANGAGGFSAVSVSSPLSYSGGALSLSQVNGSTNGYLSAADWTLFNNKISSTSLSGGTGISYNSATGVIGNTGVLSFNGRTGTVVPASGDYTTAQVTESGNLYYTDARARAALSFSGNGLSYNNGTGVLSIAGGYNIPLTASTTDWNTAYLNRITTATAPLSITNNVISMTQANTSTNGYLSSTDWNTFNTKFATSSTDYWLSTKSTANLAEGSNLYYTDARVGAYISSSSTIPHVAGAASGDTLSWNGSAWVARATSTLGVNLNDVTGVLTQEKGGTGFGSYSAGDVLYADLSGNLQKLPAGSTGSVLKVQGGIPSWGVDETIGAGGSDGIFATSSGKIYPINSSSVVLVGTNATSTNGSLFEVNGASYFSGNVGIGSTSPSVKLSVTGNASVSGNIFAGGSGTFGSLSVGSLSGLLYGNNGAVAAASVSGPLSFTGGSLSITQSNTSTNGYLSSTDWNTFNNKVSTTRAINTTYPLLGGGDLSGDRTISLAFGTTTANTWAQLQTFTSGINIGGSTFTSLLGTGLVNSGGALSVSTSTFSGSGSNFNADLLDGLDSTYFLANGFGTTSANYWLSTKSTSNLAEGSNLYYTDTRARAALSFSGSGLSYNNGTGVLSIAAGYTIPLTASTTDWNTAYLSRITTANAPLSIANNTISITQANTSTNGYLSSADWNTFNGKVSSTSLSAVYPIQYNSGTGAFSLAFGTTTANSWSALQTFNGGITTAGTVTLGSLNGLLYGNNGAVSTASVSGPLSFTGGALSISQANTSTNGYLSSADYTLFNNKISSSSLSGGTGISYNGTTGVISNTGVTSNVAGSGISVSGATGAVTITNTGVLSFAQTYGSAQTGAITLASSTSGTDFSITNASGAFTFNLPSASASNRGLLTAADWSTFSGKQSALSFTYPLVNTSNTISLAFGTTTANSWSALQTFTVGVTVTGNTVLGNASSTNQYASTLTANIAAFGQTGSTTISSAGALTTPSLTIGSLNGILYGNAGAVSTASVSSPLSFTGGALSISQANSSTNGYLSSADYTLFNNKISSSSLSGASVISYNSSSGVITTTPGAFAGSGSYTFPGNVGVGNPSPTQRLSVIAAASQTGLYIENQGNATYPTAVFKNNQAGSYASIDVYGGSAIDNTNKFQFGQYATGDAFYYLTGNNNLDFYTNSQNRIRLTGGGNVGIGSTTPYAKLSVAGDIALTGGIYDNNATRGASGQVLMSTGTGVQWTATSSLGIPGGTVTSVNASGGITGLSFSGGPITTSGTLTLSGTLGIANGGTNAASQTSSGVAYYDGTKLTTGSAFTYNGTDVALTGGSFKAPQFLASDNSGAPGFSWQSDPTTGIYHAGSNLIGFATGGVPRAYIDGNGFLGIGSSTPSVALSVNGSALISSKLTVANTVTFTSLSNGLVKSTSGVLSAATPGTDYQAPLGFTYPLQNIGNMISLAFGTTTANGWSALQTFNGGITTSGTVTIGSLNGLVGASNGVLYQIATSTNFVTSAAAGSGISLSGSTGAVTITNTGVLSVAQTYGSAQTGAITLASSTNGTDFSITNASGAFTFNLPTASASARGLLSSADWSTFTAKQAALTFSYPLVNTGNTVSLAFGTTTANSWSALQTFNGGITTSGTVTLGSLNGILYGNSGVVGTATVNSPLSFTGGALSISQANGSTNGYLSSADWTLFNNKISSTSLSGGTGISYNSSTGVISNTGVTSNVAGAGISLSGSTGAVTVTNTGVLSLAQTYGSAQAGAITLASSTSGTDFSITNASGAFTFNLPSASATSRGALTAADWSTFSGKQTALTGTAGQFPYFSGTNTVSATSNLFMSGSNIGIGSTSPSQTLSVGGNAYISGTAYTSGTTSVPELLVRDYLTGNAAARVQATVAGGLSILDPGNGGQYLYIDPSHQLWLQGNLKGSGYNFTGINQLTTTGNVGIGTTSPYASLSVSGNIALTGGIYDNNATRGASGQVLQSTGTGVQWVSTSTLGFASASGSTGQVAYYSGTGTLTGSSGFTYDGTNLTVNNIISSGSQFLGVGGTGDSGTPSYSFTGDTTTGIYHPTSNTIGFSTGGVPRARIDGNGFFGIGTTTPSAALSVNGSALISSKLTAQGTVTFTGIASGLVGSNGGALYSIATSTNFVTSAAAGSGISLSGSTGAVTITNTGVLSLAQTYGSAQTGAITLASSTSGTDFSITNASGAFTFNLPTASAANRGLLSSADWSTFNAKQAALTFSYPLVNTSNTISLAFGTTTANSWSALQTFNGGITTSGTVTLGSLTGILRASSGVVSTGNVNLASEVTGTLPVSNGGTGSTTLTGLLKGNGTGGVLTAVAGTDYQSAGNYITALTGDVTASGPGSAVATLATVNSNTGSFGGSTAIPTFTVNGKGLITAAGTAAVIAPAGTLTGTTLASGVTASSLTSLGTLTALNVSGNTTLANATSTNEFTGRITANTAAFGQTGSTTVSSTGALTTPSLTVGSLSGLLYGNSGVVGAATVNGPLSFTGGALSIANAVADGATKGAAAFTAADFNDASGVISLDYANGQKATGSVPGFLSSTDWTTFNSKQAALTGITGQFPYFSGTNTVTATSSVFLASNGNFGVGTTTPWAQLSINPNGIAGPAFAIGSSTATKFLVTNGGQVAINTTSPAANTALTIAGISGGYALNASGFSILSGSTTIGASVVSTDNNSNYSLTIAGNTRLYNPGAIATIRGYTSTSGDVTGQSVALLGGNGTFPDFGNGGNGGDLYLSGGLQGPGSFGMRDGNVLLGYNGSTYAGNVGIGTTSPYALLSVGGNVVVGAAAAGGTPGDLFLPKLGTSAGSFLAVDANGKVIATTTPSSGGSGTVGTGIIGQVPFYAANGTTLTATSSLYMASNGNVGVGTANPSSSKLSVFSNLNLGSTAGVGEQSAASSTFTPTLTLSGSLSNANQTLNASRSELNLSGLTMGNIGSGNGNLFNGSAGSFLVTGSPTFNDNGSGDGYPNTLFSYGVKSVVSLTPSVIGNNSGADALASYAGYFQNTTALSGNSASVYGLYVESNSTLSSTAGAHFGGKFIVDGTASNNSGFNVDVSGATYNQGLNLQVYGAGSSQNTGLNLSVTDGGYNTGLYSYVEASSTNYNIYADGGAQSYFNGFVGIGTSTPYAALSIGSGDLVLGADLAGDTPGDLFLPKLGTTTGSFLAVDASGKVIATSTPSSGSSYSFTYPLVNTSNVISLAFGTTTANSWSALQTFNGGLTTSGTVTLGSLSGLLKASSGVVSAAVAGTDYAPATSGSAILYGNGAGGFSPVTIGTGINFSGGTLSSTVSNYFTNSGTNTYLSTGNTLAIGTTSSPWLLDVGTSSVGTLFNAGQFGITDTNAASGLKHLVFSNENGNLYISPATDVYATTTLSSKLSLLTSGSTAVTGLSINSKAAGLGLGLIVSSTGANENLTIDAKGTGSITIGAAASETVTLGNATIGVTANKSLTTPIVYGGTAATSNLILRSTTGTGTTDAIIFGVGTAGGTEAGRIIHSGFWGIGTTTPYQALSLGGGNLVLGASAAGGTPGDLYLPKLGVAAGTFLAVDSAGKVIATTTPSSGGSGTVGTGTIGQVPYYATNGTTLTATSSLFIASSGNVGIGSTSPSSALSITGDVNATGKVYVNNTQALYIPSQSSFTGTLFVGNGGASISHSSGTQAQGDTAVGVSALAALTTGYQNSAVGYNALASATTGFGNSALGYNALASTTYGNLNAALGTSALAANVGGYQNAAVGYQALAANTSGANNTAQGYAALAANTTGNQNSAFGGSSLMANTGNGNSAFGEEAMYSNIGGSYNSVIGSSALYTNTSGNYNAVLGYAAAFFNTTGTSNIANGTQALYFNSTGSNNAAIGDHAGYGAFGASNFNGNSLLGYQAGYALRTSGDNNTLLGYTAGNNITSGARNIIIGYNTTAQSATANDQLNIGNTIYGDLSNKLIGIGTTTPYAALSIGGGNLVLGAATAGGTPGDLFLPKLGTSAGSFLAVDATGKVIATTTPGGGGGGSGTVGSGTTGQFPYYAAGGTTLTATSNLFMDTSGNIGIGTVSPAARLHVVGFDGTSGAAPAAFQVAGGTGAIYSAGGAISLVGGTGGIGDGDATGGPGGALTLSGGAGGSNSFGGSGGNGGNVFINGGVAGTSASAGNIILGYRFGASGRVGIGTNAPSAQLHTTGTVRFANFGAGTLQTDSSGNVTVSSDERLKDVTGSFSRGLADIQKLNPILYHWNAVSGLNQEDLNAGFSAQNVQGAIPEAVGADSRGYLTLQDRPILAASVNAIKELAGQADTFSATLSTQATSLSLATTTLGTQLGTLSLNATTLASQVAALQADFASSTMPHALTATSVTADSMTIAQSFTADSVTSQTATVSGTASANRYVVPQSASTFSFGSSTIAVAIPQEALTDGGNVDLYKLASFAIANVQNIAQRTDLLSVKIDDLETRLAALESLNAKGTDSTSTLAGAGGLALATIQDALNSIGIVVKDGMAMVDKLVTHQLVLVKGADGTSSTGSSVIPAGATQLVVSNALVHSSSKIFLTFTSSVDGGWYLSQKQEGSFTLTLAKPQPADVEFDYFLLQTDANAQVAAAGATQTGTPPNTQTPPAPVAQDGGPTVSLKGDAAMQIVQGGAWTDPGATAAAADGTDLTASIAVSGGVDANTPGTYTVTYRATDAAGKFGEASRVVVVLAPAVAPAGDATVTQAPAGAGAGAGSTGTGTAAGAGAGSTAGAPAPTADAGTSAAGGTTAAAPAAPVSAAPDATPAS